MWRSYKNIALLGKDNTIRVIDLGLITSSSANSMVTLILNRLRQDGDVSDSISPRFLVRNWPPAFKEWSTKSIRDAFFASPQFPRLLNAEVIKDTIAHGVSNSVIAYVGKSGNGRYEPFYFNTGLSPSEVEISDDMFIITASAATEYLKRITAPPKLTTLVISPTQVRISPGKRQTFAAKGLDQYDKEIVAGEVLWSATGGTISQDGVLLAGSDAGNFTVTATVGKISAQATFTVITQERKDNQNDEDDSGDGSGNEAEIPIKLAWRGEVPHQKWMNFYMRVFSKFTSDRDLKLTLKVEVSAEGEISEQKLEETKVALQELGLNGDVEMQ